MLGIRPWEWSLMTVEQEDAILDWLEAYQAELEAQAEKLK